MFSFFKKKSQIAKPTETLSENKLSDSLTNDVSETASETEHQQEINTNAHLNLHLDSSNSNADSSKSATSPKESSGALAWLRKSFSKEKPEEKPTEKNELIDESIHQSINDKLINDKLIDNQSINHQLTDDKPIYNKSINESTKKSTQKQNDDDVNGSSKIIARSPYPTKANDELLSDKIQEKEINETNKDQNLNKENKEKENNRQDWLTRLKAGLRKTSSSIATVFTGTKIDDALYEELEAALLMADAGVKATEHLLNDLKRRVKESKTSDPSSVKALLADALSDLLKPLEKSLVIGEFSPTVIMVAGVNGAGKTTSIGKLTKHLSDHNESVLLAAADTFRAAAKEQLSVWATRNTVEIVGQEGGDPAAVSFDAISAGKARKKDVVLIDTAGRLPTQLHLMEELKKIKRVITKAEASAPHEVLLVIDGNTGQNALMQVKAFDDALKLTGLIVTKLDGTAKGGVLAAIAQERAIPVYFIGVGEKLEDLQTFNAREFAQALLY